MLGLKKRSEMLVDALTTTDAWLEPFASRLAALIEHAEAGNELPQAAFVQSLGPDAVEARRIASSRRLAAGCRVWNSWATAVLRITLDMPVGSVVRAVAEDVVRADFSGTRFDRAMDCSGLVFPGGAWFEASSFADDVWFQHARFTASADFTAASFEADANFECVRFHGPALFDNANIMGSAQFRNVEFHGRATFCGARFARDAWFRGSTSAADISFADTSFAGEAGFGACRFAGPADFSDAHFGDNAGFDGCGFNSHVTFARAVFNRAAWFKNAIFTNVPVFDLARFCDRVHLEGASQPASRPPVLQQIDRLETKLRAVRRGR